MLIVLTLGLLFQASAMRWLFPGGGAPNLVLAAVLLIALRKGRLNGLVTGLWGGLLVGALRGAGALPSAAFYAAMGWIVGSQDPGDRHGLVRSLLLAAGLSLVATCVETALVGGLPMWRCALVSLAPQMLFQICLITVDEISLVLL